MATNNNKKSKKGGITGSELNSKTRGGKTTAKTKKSKHFDDPDTTTDNTDGTSGVSQAAQTIGQGATTVVNGARKVGEVARNTQRTFKTIRRAATGSSELVTADTEQALEKANKLGDEYGVEQFDVKSALRVSSYEVNKTIPELSSAEANQLKLQILRQNNALDIRRERTSQDRKIVALNTEEVRLIGDLVDNSTAKIETATKVVNNQIANTDFGTAQSRLEEHEELQTQQTIKTQGTVNLTEEIREEWDLKLQQQQANNQKLRVAIEKASQDIARGRREVEALMYTVDI